MSEMKPCPFCGRNDNLMQQSWAGSRMMRCDIPGCGATGGYIYDFEDAPFTQEEVRQRWNTRPIEDKLKAEIERLKAEISKHAVFLAIHGVEGYEFVPNPTCDDCDLNPPLCDSCIGA